MTMRFPLLPAALSLALAATTPALAQSDQGDPPARVARLAEASGTVSFHTSDENQWQPATVNYPVTSGNSFWADQRSHAAIDIGGGRLYLDSQTELDIGTVDDQGFAAQIPQGAVYLRAPDAAPSNQYEIDTPRGAVHIGQPGQYEVIAGDNDRPTQVVVYQGSAQIQGPGVNMALGQGQAASITGQDQFQAQTIAAPPPDDFLRFVQSEEQPYQQQAAQSGPTANPTAQYVSPQETGYQDLSRYGSWSQTPDYGAVWYPQVEAGWAPYRNGHWAYVAPWGWTWIDDARWGFTPFHYGRWAQYQNRWCWIPGTVVARPVYAPALVTFFGNVAGLAVGAAIGGNVGWVPLGPQEVYVPWYRHGPRYLQNVNITNVRNVTVINNTTIINNYNSYDINHFHNHGAATLVSADAMTHSRPIAAAFRQTPQNASQWGKVKPMVGAGRVIKPTYNTVGVTPKVAKRIGVTPPAGGNFPVHQPAPGPRLRIAQNNGQLPTFNKPGNKPGNQPNKGGTPSAPGQNRPQNNAPKNGNGQNLPNLHTGGTPGPAINPNQNKNLPQLHNNNGGQLPTIYHGNQSGTPGGGSFKPNQPQFKPQNGNGQAQQHNNNQPQFKPQNGNGQPQQHNNNQPQFKPQNGEFAQQHNNQPQHNNQQHKPECKKPNGQPC